MNTIKVKNNFGSGVVEEIVASAEIYPGHLVALASTGKVAVHGVASANVLPMFALEDELQGKGIDDKYIAGDRVQCWIPQRGDQVLAKLKDGENVAVGDFLASAGDGTLRKHQPQIDSADDVETIVAEPIVGVALEAKDMTGSAGVDPSPFIIVRVL